jgi:hypothetical protein
VTRKMKGAKEATPPGLHAAAGSDDDGHRIRRVEKVAMIGQQLGMTSAMTHMLQMCYRHGHRAKDCTSWPLVQGLQAA